VTVEEAIAWVRETKVRVGASSVLPSTMDWRELAIAADALATRVRELEAELEREGARAGWPVLCTSPSRVLNRNERPNDRMWLNDAIRVARDAIEEGVTGTQPPRRPACGGTSDRPWARRRRTSGLSRRRTDSRRL
jgi:hypothetical protein